MNNHQASNDGEIDLSVLILHIITVLQRSTKLLASITLLGLLAGVLYYFFAKPVYETSMIASSKVLTNVRVQNLIQVLDELAEENNSTLLSKKLHISPSLATAIKSIEAKGIIDPKDRDDSDKTRELDDNVFEVTLSTYDNQKIDSLQTGILYYLQNNTFVEKRIAIKKQNLIAMRERVKEEVKKLDSLRFSVNKLLAKGVGNNSTMLISDPASVNKDIMSLYERDLQIKADLLLIDDIQIIQDFTQFDKPVNPQLLQSITASIGSAITLAFVLIAILEVRRGMRKLKQELEQKVLKDKEFV